MWVINARPYILTINLHKNRVVLVKTPSNYRRIVSSNHMGTVVKKDDKEIILHNIAGIPTNLDATQVTKTEPGLNMMSLHLCDELTLPEFADLIGYIKSMDTTNKK